MIFYLSVKYVLISVTGLCAAGFSYGLFIYNKRFNPLRIHLFSVTLVVLMLAYLLLCAGFSFYCFYWGKPSAGILCLVSLLTPFIIGVTGNRYSRAKLFFAAQIAALSASSVLFALYL